MIETKTEKQKSHLYMEVYRYYREMILEQKLPAGSRMPSLRTSCKELKVSRTTVETAYLQLAADGYILSRPQSGYYVTQIALHKHQAQTVHEDPKKTYLFDFASTGVDRDSFRFDLWRRYIKSALRQDERLLTYGEAQGEADFRQSLADYIKERRNILCSPDDIVVGASVQSLLQILCPIILEYKNRQDPSGALSVSFPTPAFLQGSTIFRDYGFDVCYRNKDSNIIYVSPAHMTKWGDIMSVRRRVELLQYAAAHESLVIEDDYENEFVYLQKPTPSLFGLAGGENVIYIGSFSRLLLPSIRISFMVLPPALLSLYQKKSDRYNQTASKVEQIALSQFIRDGHLAAQTRKLRRLYVAKQKALLEILTQTFGATAQLKAGASGTSLAMTLPFAPSPDCLQFVKTCEDKEHGVSLYIKKQAQTKGLRLNLLPDIKDSVTLILSCSSMPVQDFAPACRLLKEVMDSL